MFTGQIVHDLTSATSRQLLEHVYRDITCERSRSPPPSRITDVVLAFPLAYYAARLATPRMRDGCCTSRCPAALGQLPRPRFAWKLILTPERVPELGWWSSVWTGSSGDRCRPRHRWPLRSGRIWLLSRPSTCGSRSRCCRSTRRSSGFRVRSSRRRATWALAVGSRSDASCPSLMPGLIVAGSIFSFSLTLGDYIAAVSSWGITQFIGNVIYDKSAWPATSRSQPRTRSSRSLVMAVYLLVSRSGRRVRGALTMETGARRDPGSGGDRLHAWCSSTFRLGSS